VKRRYTVAEFSQATGLKANTVRAWIRHGSLLAIDLNEETGKRPRYRIPARELRRILRELDR
jgi:DNA-binding transcriptional MerR regulator